MDLKKLTKQVNKVVDKAGDKIAAGVDKATDVADKKTKGRYHDKLEKLDGLAQKLDKKKEGGAGADSGGTNDPT